MLTYVIGDIHGNILELKRLMDQLRGNHKFVFLGDYIDKGKNSIAVLNYLISFAYYHKCVFLMGNHEYKLLQGDIDFIEKFGGKETIKSYTGKDIISKETWKETLSKMKEYGHFSFLCNLQLYHKTKEYYILHAGYNISYEKLNDVLLIDPESILFSKYDFISSRKKLEGKKIIFGHTAFKKVYEDDFKIGIDTGAGYGGELTAYCIERNYFVNSKKDVI
jgi:serine/threonine protein phosphatase 1